MIEGGIDRVSALLLAPLVLATLVVGLGRMRLPAGLIHGLAVLGAAGTALLAGGLAWSFDPTQIGFQFVRFVPWIPAFGAHYHVGVDGLNLGLVVTVALLIPILLLANWGSSPDRLPARIACIFAIEFGLLGALLSLNLLLFFLFVEGVSLGLALLVGVWGASDRLSAATRYYTASSLGSLLVFAAFLIAATMHVGQTGSMSFDLVMPPRGQGTALLQTALPVVGRWWTNQSFLLSLIVVGLALRAPWFPFHGWLRQVGRAAPTDGVVLLVAAGSALAAYTMLRFALPLLPVAAMEFGYGLASLAAGASLYSGLVAFAQRDLRSLVLGLCSAQMLLIMVGIFVVNVHGWNGSVVHLMSYAFGSSALLLLVGMLEQRRSTRSIDSFGGIARPMPVFAFFFGVSLLAMTGVPLLAGFVGEMLILLGAFLAYPEVAAIAALAATGMAAVAWVTLRRVLFGPIERGANLPLIDLGWREKWILVALLVPIVWIGIWPSPILRRVEPAVIDWVEHVRQAQPEVASRSDTPAEPAP